MNISKHILVIALPISIVASEEPKSLISLSDRMEFTKIIKNGSLNHFVNKLYPKDARAFPIDDEIIDNAHEHAEFLQSKNGKDLSIFMAICFENMLRCEKAAQANNDQRIIRHAHLVRQENSGSRPANIEHERSSLAP